MLIGHVDEVTRFVVAGWAADEARLATAVNVVVFVNGRNAGRIAADTYRDGLQTLRPGATGRYAFRFYFDPPLFPFQPNEVEVRVEGAEDILPNGHQVLPPVTQPAAAGASRPAMPILVTTSSRVAGTVLMGLLDAHPQIAVASRRPFDVQMLRYYAFALRTLIAPADPVRSLRHEDIAAPEHRYAVGFNPFTGSETRQGFGSPDLLDRFLNRDLPRRLGAAFRESICDFYGAVGSDRGKHAPLYFAEQSSPEEEVRAATRFMFGTAKEIVLVEDLRDVLCFLVNTGRTDLTDIHDMLMGMARRYLEIEAGGDPATYVMRYEDLVQRPAATLARLYGFLGLAPMPAVDAATVSGLLQDADAPGNASDSIGLWRLDLGAEHLALCRDFEPFLQAFGYEAPQSPPGGGQPPAGAPQTGGPASAAPLANDRTPAAQSLTAKATHELPLLGSFESLGENCEFGLVQRRCGCEPLGLFRFSSTPYQPLLHSLRAGFIGMGQPEALEVELAASGHEYMVLDRRFGFRYHAWVKLGEMDPGAIRAREARRLPFLIRKLIGDLAEGDKIFVFHGMTPLTDAQASDLAAAIRRFGPGTLLWVEKADAAHPPGSVVPLGPGLLKGHMDRFAPTENAHDLSLDCWIALCRNAHALVHQSQAA
jgi:hypothetical protein